ncbi:MAG: acyl carrier protein [Oscillospiraceae bacterium]
MVFDKVCEVLADVFSCDEDAITMDTSFIEDLGADSVDVVEIAYALEEEFGLDPIPDDELKRITTVGDLVAYITDTVGE